MMSQPKLHHVFVVTIFDTFEPSSNMLISTWLASTVLNSYSHIKILFYGITPKKVCLIVGKKRCLVVTLLKATHRFSDF